MNALSSVTDLLRSPRAALYANVALVCTASTLALLALIDLFTGVLIVGIGLVGIAVSLVGRSVDDVDAEVRETVDD